MQCGAVRCRGGYFRVQHIFPGGALEVIVVYTTVTGGGDVWAHHVILAGGAPKQGNHLMPLYRTVQCGGGGLLLGPKRFRSGGSPELRERERDCPIIISYLSSDKGMQHHYTSITHKQSQKEEESQWKLTEECRRAWICRVPRFSGDFLVAFCPPPPYTLRTSTGKPTWIYCGMRYNEDHRSRKTTHEAYELAPSCTYSRFNKT